MILLVYKQVMSAIRVFPVQSKREKKAFIDLVWKIYNAQDHPQWVPPLRLTVYETLDTKKNPFYKRCDIQLFLAERNGESVGRIAAIENRGHNDRHSDKVGFYGFFESIDDQEVANALFQTAQDWLRQRGLDRMRGPMNPSVNHECGLLVRGQSQHPMVMTTWNPKYYQTLHEKAGLVGCKDLVAYFIPTETGANLPERTLRFAEEARKATGMVFREVDLKHYDRDVGILFEIYNSAWENNWGFFPMTREEFFHAAKDMKLILDRRFALIAEVGGKPAGFVLLLPDVNQILKRIPDGRLFPTGFLKLLFGRRFLKTVRVVALGVKAEYRKTGIMALFTQELYLRAVDAGILAGEASWILEDNEGMNKPWREIGAPIYRRWRIYECPTQT